MHDASLRLMEEALNRASDDAYKVLDVGSRNVNGSYRELIERKGWAYFGLDIVPGDNVDVVADGPASFPFDDAEFDIVISGSVAYQVLDLMAWIKEITRVLRPGGLLVIITPSLEKPKVQSGGVDYWRMTPLALAELFTATSGLEDIQTKEDHLDVIGSALRNYSAVIPDTTAVEEFLNQGEPDSELKAVSPDEFISVEGIASPRHPSQKPKTPATKGKRK